MGAHATNEMENTMKYLSSVALMALLLSSTSASAVDMTNARVFVTPTGNDASCRAQPISAGPNPNLIYAPYIPCRTIQRACDIAVGIPMVHVAPAANMSPQGVYYTDANGIPAKYQENVTCNISGTDAAHPVFFHIAEQVQPLGSVHMTGVPGVVKPILEMTGNFVHLGCAFCHIEGGESDGVYMHGLDDSHHAVGQNTYYGTDISRNKGFGVHVKWSDNAIVTSDTMINDVAGAILIENSIAPHVYSNALYRTGILSGISQNPTSAAVIWNSPGGEFEDNKALYAVKYGLELHNSPAWTVDGNHVTAAGYPPFSYLIDPPSDAATDTIGPN